MNASRNFGVALLLGVIGAVVGIALLIIFILPGGLGGGDDSAGGLAQSSPTQSAPETQAQAGSGQDVSQEEAGEIAVAHLGGGEVTWTSREDDHGALWEIEVTGSDGSESNVYVNAAGDVTHVSGPGQSAGSGGGQQPGQQPEQQAGSAPAQPQPVDAQRAGEIAAGHVGGTVSEVYREDDYGAAWEVAVYAAEGEYDVYVNSAGDVIRADGPYVD